MRVFMLRSKPHNIDRIDHFLKENEIAIGWSETGDLTGATKEDIRSILADLGYEGQSLLTNLGLVNSFINTMKEGDIVLIREGDRVHIGKVGSYKWKKEYKEKFMTHTRPTQWLAHVPFNDLNAQIQSLLKNIRTICKFKGDFEQSGLGSYLSKEDSDKKEAKDTSGDTDSLLNNAIDVLKQLMNNAEDEAVRLEAAKELLKHLNK
ncbi:hypothetical protein QNH20_01105 [Neobacillus sp. WH10]|uniref:hypothetical protein n=1 Tax=Neobacillus sp. WH10 TaxID=3047873 RepID=UPI0024C169B8|nr:hypothetical protein [Neobacillus sp. WH10]WHY77808.1 hypothetical protein QNH20_01105 [Neobacillus sp. WH10]